MQDPDPLVLTGQVLQVPAGGLSGAVGDQQHLVAEVAMVRRQGPGRPGHVLGPAGDVDDHRDVVAVGRLPAGFQGRWSTVSYGGAGWSSGPSGVPDQPAGLAELVPDGVGGGEVAPLPGRLPLVEQPVEFGRYGRSSCWPLNDPQSPIHVGELAPHGPKAPVPWPG